MTAIEDVMRAVLDARAKVYVTAREYPADRTMGDVLDLLDRARAVIEDDPGYQRDRINRLERTLERLGGSRCRSQSRCARTRSGSPAPSPR